MPIPKSSSSNSQSAEKHIIQTPFTRIECTVHYPDENPEFAARDIAMALGKAGVFDDIKKK